jgi:hypothetical protein
VPPLFLPWPCCTARLRKAKLCKGHLILTEIAPTYSYSPLMFEIQKYMGNHCCDECSYHKRWHITKSMNLHRKQTFQLICGCASPTFCMPNGRMLLACCPHVPRMLPHMPRMLHAQYPHVSRTSPARPSHVAHVCRLGMRMLLACCWCRNLLPAMLLKGPNVSH